jgi:protein involved in temperature-dependent protein secretion
MADRVEKVSNTVVKEVKTQTKEFYYDLDVLNGDLKNIQSQIKGIKLLVADYEKQLTAELKDKEAELLKKIDWVKQCLQ